MVQRPAQQCRGSAQGRRYVLECRNSCCTSVPSRRDVIYISALTIYYTALSPRCRPDRRCERVRWTQRCGEQCHVHEEHHGESILSFLFIILTCCIVIILM